LQPVGQCAGEALHNILRSLGNTLYQPDDAADRFLPCIGDTGNCKSISKIDDMIPAYTSARLDKSRSRSLLPVPSNNNKV
jgi:hypothetical protein